MTVVTIRILIIRTSALARPPIQTVHLVTNMRENLAFAFIYNAMGIPLEAGILHPFTRQFLLPMVAALAINLSSVSVIGNALGLRGTSSKPTSCFWDGQLPQFFAT